MSKNIMEILAISESYKKIKDHEELDEALVSSALAVVQIINLLMLVSSVYKLISNFHSVYKTNKSLTRHKYYSDMASKIIGEQITVNIFSAKLPCSMFANNSICISDSMNKCLNDKEMMVFILHEYGEMKHKSTRKASLVTDGFTVFGTLLFIALNQAISPILMMIVQLCLNRLGIQISKDILKKKIKLNDSYIKKFGYEQHMNSALESITTYLKDELNLSNGKIRSALSKAFKTNAYLQRIKNLLNDSTVVNLLKSPNINVAKLKELVSKTE